MLENAFPSTILLVSIMKVLNFDTARTVQSLHIRKCKNNVVYIVHRHLVQMELANTQLISPFQNSSDFGVSCYLILVPSNIRIFIHVRQLRTSLLCNIISWCLRKTWLNNFKVAVHGINKVLEPSRKSRADAKYLKRQGATYFLDMEKCWVDADQMEALISLGNINSTIDPGLSSEAYRLALDLHNGTFLPNRVYEDWSSEERERLQS